MFIEHACEVIDDSGGELGPVPDPEAEMAEGEVIVCPPPGAQIGGLPAAWTGDARFAGLIPGVDVEKASSAPTMGCQDSA